MSDYLTKLFSNNPTTSSPIVSSHVSGKPPTISQPISIPNSRQKSILEFFPYKEARPLQQDVLLGLEKHWDQYDVFVIVAPTAAGKSSLARTIMEWKYGTSVITPTNMLVDQFLQEFPDSNRLHRLDNYYCAEWQQSCAATRARQKAFCKGCFCSQDLSTAKYKKGSGIYNYYTYMAHRLYRSVLVVDEAHNLIRNIQDKLALRIWQHDARYPQTMQTRDQMKRWLETLSPSKLKLKKYSSLYAAVTTEAPHYVVERTKDWFNGKGTNRGEPEERDCIKLHPVDISDALPMFWPAETEKVILMSATIGPKDIQELGLDSRRVLYMECKSPIPHEQRPVYVDPIISVSRENMVENSARMGEIIADLAKSHQGEKGVIHATYQMAEILRNHLRGDRYIFHTTDNKRDAFERFTSSAPSSGMVLVASGMYEGIDLVGDLARWQIIAKVPWKSLGDPAIRYKAEQDEDWYRWQTLKDLIQACGRVCRTPTDYGVTYLFDESGYRLLKEGEHLLPQWFREALRYE